jgi:small GTP-binding protein
MLDEDRVMKAKICLVGDSRVGKTSLIRRYVQDDFDDRYISTLGAKITKKELLLQSKDGELRVNMTVWDIMGERGLTDLLKESYFDGAGGLLVVCDLTRTETFEGLSEWLIVADSVIDTPPMTFVGNKVDLKSEQALDGSLLSSFAGEYESPYFLTSAKTGENVNAVFLDLAKRVLARTYDMRQ